jgi:stage III sporulation protein AG
MNFREMFKIRDRKTAINIGAALIIGILLLLISSSLLKPPVAEDSNTPVAQVSAKAEEKVSSEDYEVKLEKRMEESLSQISGVGKVEVMLTLAYGREIVVAEDKTANESSTNEVDGQGGSRTVTASDVVEEKIIVTNEEGVSSPIILREISPKIEGVIIICEGGENVYVKDALTKAAMAILGLEADKVQIFKMKK